ncbi:hypothetical protein Q1695_014154 [Nippostrongylus brasiliensis]|nr:hypothetical protein Q1695_014154 [Nippostrongylus brasiliensis]
MSSIDVTGYYEKSAVPLDSWMSTVVHSFMFLGLSLSTDSIWVFPLEALKHGGFFFLVVYFFVSLSIVVPLLHLEVFVSQICQAGIVQAMQMHGVGFTGFGIGIVVLTILRHHVGLHRGYYYLINIFKLFSNSESVVTCNSTYVKDAASCVSMYMDRFCRIFKRGRYLINGTCHQDAVFPESVTLASESYAHYILNIDKEGISFAVVLIQLGGLCILSLIELRLLRLVIAFIYVVTMAIYVIVIFNFPFSKSLDVMGLVAAYSNPKVIFQAETYTCALRLSISSAGLCICGIFCASSFRKRNGNSYAIAWIAFVFNYLSCFLSVLTVVVMIYLMHDASPGSLTSFSVNKQGLAFSAATIPEFFAATQNVFASIVVPYFVGAYIINWSHSFGKIHTYEDILKAVANTL